MDAKIDGNRVKTTGSYDPRILKALNRLEGMKRWGANRSFSFENTPYNLEVWRSVFPDARLEGAPPAEGAIAGLPAATEAIFDLPSSRPAFEFKTPPRAHQKAALAKLGPKAYGALFMEVGTGKSWTAIALAGQRWCAGQIDRLLVVAKNGVHQQWAREQIPAHMGRAVKFKAHVFGRTKAADREFDELLNFDGLQIFLINTEAIATPRAEEKILRFLAGGRTFMAVDESQDIKTPAAARTKAALRYAKLAKHRLIMTGTPISKNLLDLFSQFQFLHEGIVGHRYITTFKNRYCEFKQTDYGEVITGHKNEDELFSKIDPYVFRITTAEAYDLPPKHYVERPFILDADQIAVMEELKKNFFAEFQDNETLFVKNAASLLVRLQQVSCGFLPKEDGTVREFKNPRKEALRSVIEQRSGKIIIWCRFHQDIEGLSKEYGSRALKYYGQTPQADRPAIIEQFMNGKSGKDLLFASAGAAGTGLNLQGLCQTNIYYSNSFNALERWQSEGRTWRDGTTHSVTYFDLVARNSPDRKILANLKSKKSVSDLMLDDLRKLFELEEN